MFVSISEGKIVVCRLVGGAVHGRNENTYFTVEDVQSGMLKDFFRKWNVEDVVCSSTVDHPEIPNLSGAAARLMIQEALGWKEDLILDMKEKLRFAETVLNGIVANTKDYDGRPWTYLAADAAADIREVLEKTKAIR